MKDDFRKEVAFFDIIGNTISCGWCKLVYNSLIFLKKYFFLAIIV